MFYPESNIKIWQCTVPTDMRKNFDGLAALAKNKLELDPTSGELFVFTNKKKNYIKILYFDRTGYCIWAKRLEAGQYHTVFNNSEDVPRHTIDLTQLRFLLEGIVEKDFNRRKRFKKSSIE